MNIVAGIIGILIASACIIGFTGCLTHRARSSQPRPYIVQEEATGKWAIGIDANNKEPIFRALGYTDAKDALENYNAGRDRIVNPQGLVIKRDDDTHLFTWAWYDWKSEQPFKSPLAARENFYDCREAILAHDDPLLVNHFKL